MVHLQSDLIFFFSQWKRSHDIVNPKNAQQKETFHQNYITKNMSLHQIMDFPPISNQLVVSTHLKNISQIGKLPQIGVKITNIWNHHPVKGQLSLIPLVHQTINGNVASPDPSGRSVEQSSLAIWNWHRRRIWVRKSPGKIEGDFGGWLVVLQDGWYGICKDMYRCICMSKRHNAVLWFFVT